MINLEIKCLADTEKYRFLYTKGKKKFDKKMFGKFTTRRQARREGPRPQLPGARAPCQGWTENRNEK